MMITSRISKIALLGFLCVITTACSAGRVTLSQDELITTHNITVIPYKSSPIKIEPNAAGALVPFGTVINVAIMSDTSVERGKLAEYFNKAGGAWNPSLITAEECLKVLKQSSKVSIVNSSIGELSEIPGADRLRKEEPRIFTETNSYWSYGWDSIWKDFRDTNTSLLEYKKYHAEINSDWLLEIFDFGLYFTNDVIHLGVMMKLNNSSSNKKVAVGWKGTGWNGYKYDIPEFQKGFQFIDFEQRFRDVSQKACSEVLKEMGLY
jgi:hypothetical protein